MSATGRVAARHLRRPGRGQVDARRAAGRADTAPEAVVVPMDGFHLHDDELARLGLEPPQGRARDLRRRRLPRPAAPAAHRDRPHGLRAGVRPVPGAGGRRRGRRTPGAPAGRHRGQLPAATTDRGWSDVRPLLDEVWFVEADETTAARAAGGAARGARQAARPRASAGPPSPTRPTPTWSPPPASGPTSSYVVV